MSPMAGRVLWRRQDSPCSHWLLWPADRQLALALPRAVVLARLSPGLCPLPCPPSLSDTSLLLETAGNLLHKAWSRASACRGRRCLLPPGSQQVRPGHPKYTETHGDSQIRPQISSHPGPQTLTQLPLQQVTYAHLATLLGHHQCGPSPSRSCHTWVYPDMGTGSPIHTAPHCHPHLDTHACTHTHTHQTARQAHVCQHTATLTHTHIHPDTCTFHCCHANFCSSTHTASLCPIPTSPC